MDPLAVGADWDRKLHLAVSRGLDFDARQAGRDWCCHVQYAELLAAPLDTLRRIYAHFGDAPLPLHERRARVWLRERPQDLHGRHRYRACDFGLADAAIRERYGDYCRRFDVTRETAP
jgi:hypothetical protein